MIPYGHQDISEDDINAVVGVMRSEWLTQGPMVPRFEKAMAEYSTAKYALAVNSATSALHISCMALDVGPGDWVWTSPNTFVASANCAEYCGAQVDFVDIDSQSYNMSVTKLATKLEQAQNENRLPKVVIAVHFAGQSCDMEAIHNLSKKYGFYIVEDASHAVGGTYQGRPIGNCQFSDVSIFSFHPVKIITTAEGGLALTNDPSLAEKMTLLRSHGVTRDQQQIEDSVDGPWHYKQITLGYNYRMTEIQAALGLSQMSRLDEYVAKRNEISKWYDQQLSDTLWITPAQESFQSSARHLYVVRLPDDMISQKLDIFNFLREKGVGVNVHYIPVHTQPYYREKNIDYGDLSASEKYYHSAISIPLYPTLDRDDQQYIISCLTDSLSRKRIMK
tara:strand:+ start:6818 stop:7990 length:1173 start_codon:yes stop_codon:yes gene_type:complete